LRQWRLKVCDARTVHHLADMADILYLTPAITEEAAIYRERLVNLIFSMEAVVLSFRLVRVLVAFSHTLIFLIRLSLFSLLPNFLTTAGCPWLACFGCPGHQTPWLWPASHSITVGRRLAPLAKVSLTVAVSRFGKWKIDKAE
jgi:hypothetical protein